MNSVMLAIIFNQDFSKNIEKLELIYAKRFSNIQYIVPAHYSRLHKYYINNSLSGSLVFKLDKVISRLRSCFGKKSPFSIVHSNNAQQYKSKIHHVFGDQFYFYHFIYQAADQLLKSDSQWFWFLGDDAILNKSINEGNILEYLGLPDDCDAVMCQPVISDDLWLRLISGSIEKAKNKIINLVGTDQPYIDKLEITKENPQSENETVSVACADFLGIRRDVLIKSLEYFKTALKNKVYVELAVPNIITHVAQKPAIINDFDWVRQPTTEELSAMIDRLHNTETVFVHPVKLSMMSNEDVINYL